MKVQLTDLSEKTDCLWCSKERECVTADFDDSFFNEASLCWSCLQNAIRVRSRQPESKTKGGGKGNSPMS